jgi:hypothetical protein
MLNVGLKKKRKIKTCTVTQRKRFPSIKNLLSSMCVFDTFCNCFSSSWEVRSEAFQHVMTFYSSYQYKRHYTYFLVLFHLDCAISGRRWWNFKIIEVSYSYHYTWTIIKPSKSRKNRLFLASSQRMWDELLIYQNEL